MNFSIEFLKLRRRAPEAMWPRINYVTLLLMAQKLPEDAHREILGFIEQLVSEYENEYDNQEPIVI